MDNRIDENGPSSDMNLRVVTLTPYEVYCGGWAGKYSAVNT